MRRLWLPLVRAHASSVVGAPSVRNWTPAAVSIADVQTRSRSSKAAASSATRSSSPSSHQPRNKSNGPFQSAAATTTRRASGIPAVSAAKMVSAMHQQTPSPSPAQQQQLQSQSKKRPTGKQSAREKAEVDAQLEALVTRSHQASFEPTLEFLRSASRVLQQCKARDQIAAALPLCAIVEHAAIVHGTATMECVRIYQRVGRHREVVALAQRLFANDFFLTNPVLANAIQACSALDHDVDKGFALFATAVERGTIPNLTVYSALLALCGAAGDTTRVQHVLTLMHAAGLEMNHIAYHNLMSAYAKGGFHNEAIRLFGDLQQSGLAPDEHTYAILMDAYAESGDYDAARKLFDELEASKTLQPNVVHYNVMLKACGKASELPTAFQLYEAMKAKGLTPDRVTYITMMHAVFHGDLGVVDTRKVKLALAGVGAIGAASVPFIDWETQYLTVLFCSSLVGSMGLAAYMNPDGVLRALYPNSDEGRTDGLIDAFFRRLREEDHCGRTIYLWREMRKLHVTPDPRVYDVLVRTCVKKRHPELAFDVVFDDALPLVDATTKTFVLPLPTTVQLLQSLLAQRRTKMADTLFAAARQHRAFADVFHAPSTRRRVFDLRTFGSGAVRSYVIEQVIAELRAFVAAESKIVGMDDVEVPDVDFLVLHGFELLDQLDAENTGIRELFSMDDMKREAVTSSSANSQYYFRLSVRGAALKQFFATTTGIKDVQL